MAIEVFNRHENKYLIDENTYESMCARLSDYMELESYNRERETYSICNVYYDTDDDYLIRTSIKKPRYKEKLRLRSYGTPNIDSEVYVEIKKKICGFVNKRRSALRLDEAYEFLNTTLLPETHPEQNRQVLKEIKYILEQHNLEPKLYLAYERRAYFDAIDHDLRISFDTDIITRRNDIALESGIYGEKLLKDGKRIMEIKTSKNIPLWLTQLLSEYKIYPTSFSKYGKEYINYISSRNFIQKTMYIFKPESSGMFLSS